MDHTHVINNGTHTVNRPKHYYNRLWPPQTVPDITERTDQPQHSTTNDDGTNSKPIQNSAMSASSLAAPNLPTLMEPTMVMKVRSHHNHCELGAVTILPRALSQVLQVPLLSRKMKEKKK